MTRLTEDHIETFTLERLEAMRYDYAHGPSIAHDGEHPERENYEQVLLASRVQEVVNASRTYLSFTIIFEP